MPRDIMTVDKTELVFLELEPYLREALADCVDRFDPLGHMAIKQRVFDACETANVSAERLYWHTDHVAPELIPFVVG